MKLRFPNVAKAVLWVVAVTALVGLSAAAMPAFQKWLKPRSDGDDDAAARENGPRLLGQEPDTVGLLLLSQPAWVFAARAASGELTNTLCLRGEEIQALGIRTVAAHPDDKPRVLEMTGSLGPDTDRLVPVRSRFAGEVVEIAEVADRDPHDRTAFRPVRTGDKVMERQLLAVVWSKDLGEKKSELLDAVSKLKLDQDTLKRLEDLYAKAAVPERSLREAERNVDADRIAVSRAEQTLRSWQLTDSEIQEIYDEANRTHSGDRPVDKQRWRKWARVEVWAPFDGTLLEKNVTKGTIIDTSTNLFMVGDLQRLSAVAYPYEEEIPLLKNLPRPIPWTIRLKAEPSAAPLHGTITEIRPMIDPAMHTGLVKGLVKNPDERMLQGQFITARVDLPPFPDEVVIPTSALVEDGQESVVFVRQRPGPDRFELRRVSVARRTREAVYLRSRLSAAELRQGLRPVSPGEPVVVSGALEMRAALQELQDSAKVVDK